MIIKQEPLDDIEIRYTQQHSPKYSCGMAKYLDYYHGLGDESSGEVDSPTGWFERFGRRVVCGDSMGFVNCTTFLSEYEARIFFRSLDYAYSRWLGDDD